MAAAEHGAESGAQRFTFGPRLLAGGGATFRLWAPAHREVLLRLSSGQGRRMRALGEGWHELTAPDARAGDRYAFELADGCVVPDPASRYQPDDVHGWSELTDPAHRFHPWSGRAWEEFVLYELHVGAFTPAGTFLAAIEKLDHLASTGITAIELMPVADFPGRRNWGYDGVLPYACDASYGRPEHLRRLVDAAHARGIAVLLDVVYNHLGPDGNYLPALAPRFFTERHETPWGAGINYDGAQERPVREFFVENALYWLAAFNLDGLRLDAVHAIADDSEVHLLEEIATRVRSTIARPVHLILENEENEAAQLAREAGDVAGYTAQWNDDIHHVLHVAATGEDVGYYSEYLGDTRKLARAIAEGFAFQGEVMLFRGRARGECSTHLPPAAFVSFIQNHDQVGNRAFGERLGALTTPRKLRAIASIYLLAPQIPMLFMGEEWNARQPFQFFCDFHGALAEAVRNGRREEFKRFPEFADPARRARIPDPQDEATFRASKLDWSDVGRRDCAQWLRWYERILGARRARIVPLIRRIERAARWQVAGEGAVAVTWDCAGARLSLAANLSDSAVAMPIDSGTVIWHEGAKPADGGLAPWSVRWTSLESAP